MAGRINKNVNPARTFKIKHIVWSRQEQAIVHLPKGAVVVEVLGSRFLVMDANDRYLFGFYNVTSFEDVTHVEEADDDQG